jgi:murein DD-endopeptidase MepM/ murein hydrolase activator NlpD
MPGGWIQGRGLAAAVISIVLVFGTAAPVAHAFESGGPEDLPSGDSDSFVIVFPQDPQGSWFRDSFGYRKASGRSHEGEDLFGVKGAPVVAAADGVVSWMDWSPRAGYYVVIQHAGGWETWYVHLNNDTPGTDDGEGGPEHAFAPGLEVGSFVLAGEQIGYVGDSGNAAHKSPHTHFEIYHDGGLVDPDPMLHAAFDRAQRLATLDALTNAPAVPV